ncbi:MAG: Gfo/Idh/MocA family oxidoreductase [Desulfurivibrio sp.]|nr:Gfo/Idh/MocA family oxidoreductase [Desulfurivibrio sp.]
MGLGQIGMGYDQHLDANYVYTHAKAFNLHPEFYLMAGVDQDREKRKNFERLYRCQSYSDIKTALACHAPHIVVVAVPTELHSKCIYEILKLCNPNVLLCEKPLSNDLPEAVNLVKLCKDRSIRFFVNYCRLSDPGVIEIKRRLDSGEISIPVKGVVWYTNGFRHNASHFVNLLEYWIGPVVDYQIIKSEPLGNSDIKIDVRVSFDKGDVFFLSGWDREFTCHYLELLCQNGRLLYGAGVEHINWCPVGGHPTIKGYTVLSDQPETIITGNNKYQFYVVDELSCILGGKNGNICSADKALETLSSIEKILE